MRRGKPTAVGQRRREIIKQLDHLRTRLSIRTRKDYRYEHRYIYWRNQYRDLINKLESELSILDEPGDYAELPLAIVADELGLEVSKVKLLVRRAEILASGISPHQRVSREELERACELGPSEMLRLASEECPTIFDHAISYLQTNQIHLADRFYRRITARESHPRTFEPALRIAIELIKGEYAKVYKLLGIILQKEPVQKTVVMTFIERCLSNLQLEDHSAHILVEQIRAITRGAPRAEQKNKNSREAPDELQRAAIYLATSIQHALAKLLSTPSSARQFTEINFIIRDAIYTALYAREHYDESLLCRAFVDTLNLLSAQNPEHAELLENVISKKL